MIVALAFLAITDLVVGVSNDAVNFLNSAIGSNDLSLTKCLQSAIWYINLLMIEKRF